MTTTTITGHASLSVTIRIGHSFRKLKLPLADLPLAADGRPNKELWMRTALAAAAEAHKQIPWYGRYLGWSIPAYDVARVHEPHPKVGVITFPVAGNAATIIVKYIVKP